MKNDKISIIVPIYNTEQYLDKCINSLLSQTYINIEIILINDGSTDNSGKICERYATEDNRVVYVNKENTGVSNSRNIGMSIARGNYILFVDSDDYVEKEMVENLYNNLKKYNADLSVGEYRTFKYNLSIMNTEDTMLSIFDEKGIQGFACSKLYKREIIEKNNIRFCEKIYICEDLLFNVEYVQYINKCVYDSKKMYNYVIRNGSALNSKFNEKWLTCLDAYEKIFLIYNDIDNLLIREYFLSYFVLLNLNVKMVVRINNYRNDNLENRIKINISKNIKKVLMSKEVDFSLKFKIFVKYYFFRIIYMFKFIKINLRKNSL